MKRRIAFFVITALIAMLIVILINSALKKKQETIEALRNSQTMVVVAASALQPGARLSLGNTKLATWPRDTAPPGAFNNPREVAGRIVRQPLVSRL
jgi:pilus assembly protein CpaB